MTDIVLTPITSGYNLSKINTNFEAVQDVINNDVLHATGGNNVMNQDLDLNGNDLLNININPNDPGSLVTVGAGDLRWYNVSGDTLEGQLDADDNIITGLPAAINPTDAVRKQEFDSEVSARTSADVALQNQLNGTTPPLASAFSVISWHDQHVTTSVNIPANKNAWSFGPVVTIDAGQTVTIGTNSHWTIANGQVSP